MEDAPTIGVIYRCHVCRLELTPDTQTGVLTVPPLRPGAADPPPTKKSTR